MALLRFLGLVCVAALGVHPAQLQQQVTLVFTRTALLSGGLTDCINLTAETCVGGLAAAAALARNWRAEGTRVVYLPKLDHTSPFVQMSRLQWAVNIPVLQRLGFPRFTASPSILADDRPANLGLLQTEILNTVANLLIPPSDKWYGLTRQLYVHERVALIPLCDETQPFCFDVEGSAGAAVAAAWRHGGNALDLTVVLHFGASDLWAFAAAVERMAVRPDVVVVVSPPEGFPLGAHGGTHYVEVEDSGSSFARVVVDYAAVEGGRPAVLLGVTADTVSLRKLPPAYKDAEYWAAQRYLQGLAAEAVAHDPVLGTSTAFMPPTRVTSTSNACMAGECPLGNLWADSFRWAAQAQVAVITTGGLRGPGWGAGPVRVSDVWASLPFANRLCVGTYRGLTLHDILNRSLALATFTHEITPTGDRLLQVAGVRVEYNPALDPAEGRIVSIGVWDDAAGAYQPLERLGLYTVATDNFMCQFFDQFPTFLAARYDGELPGRLGDVTIQDQFGQYLEAASPFTPGAWGRLVPSNASAPMAWRQALETCPTNTRWVAGLGSCLPCPVGEHQPEPGQATCVPVPPPEVILYVIPVALGVAAIAMAATCTYVVVHRRRNVRDLANAPKGGEVTLIFTDIQDSTRLWGHAPECMARALDLHHQAIRACIARHRGYEVKTVGDSFMIAVGSPQAGVNIALDIQLALQQQPFPRAMELIYDDVDLDMLDDNPEDLAPLRPLWNGLLVRIGVHTGQPDCLLDPVTKGYDYYGPMVNVAARVESIAFGGQVLVTEAVLAAAADPAKAEVRALGPFPLKGVAQPVTVHQVLPLSLVERGVEFAKRKKPALEAAAAEAEEGSDQGTVATMAGRNVMDLLTQHPLVRQRVMSVEQVEVAMQDLTQSLLATFRLLPRKTGDAMVNSVARAWRLREERSREQTLQMVALRVLPTLPKIRQRMGNSFRTIPPTPHTMRRAVSGEPLRSPKDTLRGLPPDSLLSLTPHHRGSARPPSQPSSLLEEPQGTLEELSLTLPNVVITDV